MAFAQWLLNLGAAIDELGIESRAMLAIYTHWDSLWAAAPYCLEGELFEPPASGPWARVSVIHTIAKQVTAGPTGFRRFERRGHVFVQLFADVDSGDSELSSLADATRTVLEGRSIEIVNEQERLRTYDGTTRDGQTDGRWSMAIVNVPFWYSSFV